MKTLIRFPRHNIKEIVADDNKNPDLNIVNSIFTKQPKKEVSSLFTGVSDKKTVDEKTGADKVSARQAKKILPFGLDIGTSSVKVLQLSTEQKNVVKIEKVIVNDLPIEARENPKERPAILASLLKKIISENDFREGCFVAMPNAMNKVGLVTLPQMSEGEIDKALRWEIRQATQTDIKEVSLDYILLKNQGLIFSSGQLGILTVTALKKDVLEYLTFLETAGLKPLAVDAEPLANLAVLEYLKPLSLNKAVLFLDFGAGKSSLSIICNAELVFVRALNVTGNSLTSAISEYCNVTWQEAEDFKRAIGLSALSDKQLAGQPQDKATQVKNAISPLLENMVQDIEQAFKYFSFQVTRSSIASFEKIILSGGSSVMNYFAPFLSNRLSASVEIFNPLSKFDIADKNYKLNFESIGPRLNVALGLALRGL